MCCSSSCAGINTAMEGRCDATGSRRSDKSNAATAWTAKAVVARIKVKAANSKTICGNEISMAHLNVGRNGEPQCRWKLLHNPPPMAIVCQSLRTPRLFAKAGQGVEWVSGRVCPADIKKPQ